jgi:hypothetical protein
MAKPRSLDLKICLDTNYSHTPLSIKHNKKQIKLNKGKTFIDLSIDSIDQVVDIEFFGYVADEKTQEITVELYYKDKKIDTSSLCTFYMKNNDYVSNTILTNYNRIFFNGNLKITFFKLWFECNLLSGAHITNEKRFLHRGVFDYTNQNDLRSDEKEDYDVFCVGCSFTYGHGLSKNDAWPHLLGEKLNCSVGNFGVPGLSIHGCLRQTWYCVNNLNAKNVILLLPSFHRILHKFQFLGNNAYYNFVPATDPNSKFPFIDLPKNYKKIEAHSERFGKRIIERLVKMNKGNCRVYVTSWDDDVYDSIPAGNHKLPKYTKLSNFKERASDNMHPHYKHNKLFVESISDRIDKL